MDESQKGESCFLLQSHHLCRRRPARECCLLTIGKHFPKNCSLVPEVILPLPSCPRCSLGHLIALHALDRDWLIVLLAGVFAADTFAYFVGRSFGRRKMAPKISPNKSWEGLAGGIVGSIAVLQALVGYVVPEISRVEMLEIGVVLSVCAVLGDLAISALKRACGRKDASSLLPGHGGLLDRADGLLFATPALYGLALWFG